MDRPITSFSNPRVKFLRSLRLRKHREEAGCFLVEGIRAVEEALSLGGDVQTLVYSPDLLVSDRARALLDRVGPESRLALSGEVFRSLSDRQDPQGVAAVARIQERGLGDIVLSDDLLAVVAYQLQDPGNLGTIIRTADAVGAAGVVIVEPSVDLYDPQTVRATMGSLFSLPIIRVEGPESLLPWYARMRDLGLPLRIIASSAHGQTVHFDEEYCRPVVLLVGNERSGLPDEVRQSADAVVRLPMSGRATSLNVGAATAALVYEIVRQRRAVSRERA